MLCARPHLIKVRSTQYIGQFGEVVMLKVLIVDDHDVVSQGISRVLQDVNGVDVVGVVHCGEDVFL